MPLFDVDGEFDEQLNVYRIRSNMDVGPTKLGAIFEYPLAIIDQDGYLIFDQESELEMIILN